MVLPRRELLVARPTSPIWISTAESSAQRRMLEAVGLQRVARDVTPRPIDLAQAFDRQKTSAP